MSLRCLVVLGLTIAAAACAQSPDVAAGSGGSGAGGGVVTGSGGTAPAGTGGSAVMKTPADYPHNSPGAQFPFPQGHAYAYCTLPSHNSDDVFTAYQNWKSTFYDGTRVLRKPDNDIVSEGIAYGMLIGVYMNDRPMFDSLWAYAKAHANGSGFMHWHINNANSVVDMNGATDADEDMAFALLMAAAQWGGTYQQQAVTQINAMWDKEVEHGSMDVLKPGDQFGGAMLTNPSYFAPSYYRVFAQATGQMGWMRVVDSSYTILNKAATTSGRTDGLVPNWCNADGVAQNYKDNGQDFGYDACRVPFRIGLDYCISNEARAKTYVDQILGFYTSRGGIDRLMDGYTLTEMNPSGTLGDYIAGMAYLGPGAVASMSQSMGTFANWGAFAYIRLKAGTSSATDITGGFTYFNASWGTLGLLATTGNFWNLGR